MPKYLIVRPMVESEKFSPEDQEEYWSGVGMLLYLVTHSCPDLANVRELSKAIEGVNTAAYNELLHMIKYILDMKKLGFNVEPTGNANNPWEILCFSDSDYAEGW